MTNRTVQSQKTAALAECALLVAMASLLALIKFSPLPFGGSVTAGSMLPIVLISYRRGLPWGFLSAFTFGIFRFIIGFDGAGTMGAFTTAATIFIDYIAAYTSLGIAGIFRNKAKRPAVGFALGTLLACALRYVFHLISGFLFFSEWAEWFFGEAGAFGQAVLEQFSGAGLGFIYSAVYNATYMIPETVITLVLSGLLALFPSVLSLKNISENRP